MKRIAFAIAVGVLIACGAYVFVYLYRWEWNRALMAGVFFLAAEIAIAVSVVLQRLSELTRRLDQERPATREDAEAIRRETFEPSGHFRWLRSSGDGPAVFVPVLLGAGIVLSAIAWLVERIAFATARPAAQRRLALSLATVAAGPAGGGPLAVPRGRPALQAIGLLALAATTGFGIDAIGDLTQNRSDAPATAAGSTITIEIDLRNSSVDAQAAAERLWTACAEPPFELVSASSARSTVALAVTPNIGRYAERRLRGCLEDATLDRMRARVVSIQPAA